MNSIITLIFGSSGGFRPNNMYNRDIVDHWDPENTEERSILIAWEPGNTGKQTILITWDPGNTGKRSILITWDPGNTGKRSTTARLGETRLTTETPGPTTHDHDWSGTLNKYPRYTLGEPREVFLFFVCFFVKQIPNMSKSVIYPN